MWRPGATVVTPTRRLARHLKLLHDDACAARGLAVWPTPDIVAWTGLVERLFVADRDAGRTALRWLSDDGARLAWERIVGRDPALAETIAPESLGRIAHRSWRLLHDYEIPLAALGEEQAPESAAFARWCAAYVDWLRDGAWLDPGEAAARVGPEGAGARLRFVGFDRLTPAQASFVERMRRAGIAVDVEAGRAEPGRTAWVKCPSQRAEIETAARWAAARLDGNAVERIAIVVPQLAQNRAAVRRVLDRVLVPGATVGGGPAPESASYELSAARPLGERPVVAAALAWLAACCGRVDLAACSALLRNPFCSGAEAEAAARAALDAWLRGHARGDDGLEQLAERAVKAGCPRLGDALRVALARAASAPRRALPSTWSNEFFGLLRDLGWPGDALDSAEHQARQRWQAVLAEFGAHDDVTGPVTAAAAVALLRDIADSTLFEPLEVRAPLLVIDPETCAGMRFEALWVCGLDATQWPAPALPDPFLPRAWQVRRAIPGCTPETAADNARRSFERLCASADDVILSVAEFEDDAPLLPSALLADVPFAALPTTWAVPPYARTVFDQRPALESCPDGELPPVPAGSGAAGGARVLELQAACPFRAGAELRLGARALEEPALGIDGATRGNLVHEVFASIWSVARSRDGWASLPQGERDARLRGAIAAALRPLRRGAGEALDKLLDIEAAWLDERAAELLASDLARPAFEIAGVEEPRTIEIGGLELSLRLDRVDRLADGSLAVIDYKTGATAEPKSWLDERPKLPQLPLYVEALGRASVAAVAFGRVRSGATGFAGLARDPAGFPGLDAVPKEFADWNALLLEWRRRLEALAREFATGDARLAPDPRTACRYCHLPALCRIGSTRLAAGLEDDGDDD